MYCNWYMGGYFTYSIYSWILSVNFLCFARQLRVTVLVGERPEQAEEGKKKNRE